MTRAYYNEIDPYAAEWLRTLIAADLIAPGDVDTRSIEDVRPDELAGYTQCHFFAGIGGWSAALRLAGWPDDRPVWTGSCPCQPFSTAGARAGFDDERHLWPDWHYLIQQRRPPVVFGEQVEAAIRLGWLDLVQADLEGLGYTFGAAGLPAACVGAPHIRQRLWFVADACGTGAGRDAGAALGTQARGPGAWRADGCGRSDLAVSCGSTQPLADSSSTRLEGRDGREVGFERAAAERSGGAGALADDDDDDDDDDDRCEVFGFAGLRRPELHDADGRGSDLGVGDAAGQRQRANELGRDRSHREQLARAEPRCDGGDRGPTGPWSDLVWLPCRDGKARPTQPGLQPLAHGVPNRVGRLRAYGNAIVPQVAAEFIRAYLDAV